VADALVEHPLALVEVEEGFALRGCASPRRMTPSKSRDAVSMISRWPL